MASANALKSIHHEDLEEVQSEQASGLCAEEDANDSQARSVSHSHQEKD